MVHPGRHRGTGAGYGVTSAADQMSLSGRGADVSKTDSVFRAIHRDYRGSFDTSMKRVSKSATNGWADAKDDQGFDAPSGQYFYRFTAPGYYKTRKLILVK